MYCKNCGNELPVNGNACPVCGEPVGADDVVAGTASVPARRHDSYEYARTTVMSDLATVATDCYECLGFELTGSKTSPASGTTALAFRRSRKVRGKAQLAKLQRTADELIAGIAAMEGQKTSRARMIALALGIVAALVLGVGMCCTMVWSGLMAIGVVVGLIGIAGCVANWFLYCSNVRRDTARIAPRIEAAYDQLATVCEEAQTVLAA